ncbi:MAG TPA: hypothetical protein VL400_11250 [Polyangiaceae bacterium]|jgi:hypothetical protein|nr:hypothetical protein [Polyangiaceae bacterium]
MRVSPQISTVLALGVCATAIALSGCPNPFCEGCSSNDGPSSPPETNVACVEAPAPAGAEPAIVFGDGSGSSFVAETGTAARQINYGDQGGQHFFVTVRWYAPPADGVLLLSYASATPNHGANTIFNDPGCTGWLEAKTYVQLDSASEETGQLHAAGGRCDAQNGCTYDEATNEYVLAETLAEADLDVSLTP